MLLFYHIKKLLSRIFARFIINSCVFNQIIHKIPFKLAFFDKLMKLTFKKLLIFALFILIFKLKVYKKIRTSTYRVMCGLKPILILNTNKTIDKKSAPKSHIFKIVGLIFPNFKWCLV